MASKSLSEVSSRERALVDALTAGRVVACSQLTVEQLAVTENPRHTINAELIRELVLGRSGDRLDPLGVRVHGARITGTLDLTHVPAVVGLELRGCYFERAVFLASARLPWLTLSASHLPALDADGLRVEGDVLLSDGFTVTGHGAEGAVRLLGAHLSGQLNLNGARLTNDAGPALIGDALHVYGDVFGGGFVATGHGELGSVRLPGAHISGQLNLDGAQLINNAGPALIGDHLQVNGGMFLDRFTATGHGEDGTVRLPDAHISGQLNLDGAKLTNQTGPALIGDHLQVGSDMFAEGLTATGHSTDSALRLPDAQISGQLNLNGAMLTNPAGPVLDLEDAEAKHLFLPAQVICPHGTASRSTCATPERRLALAGLVYTSLHTVGWHEWLHLITHHTRDYRPQPYQQLAAVLRATGREATARDVLIAQQRDLHDRGELGGRLVTGAHRLWGSLAGYGYRTGRLAVAIMVVLLMAAGLGVAAGHTSLGPGRYVTAHTSQADNPGTPCSLLEQIGVGIDHSLPLAPAAAGNRCDLDTSSPLGQAFTASAWILQALVWALAVLVLAGYLRLIRKTT